jgi:oligosaccharide repeat unit polymerase
MSLRNVQKRLRDGVWWVILGRVVGIGVTFLLNAVLARVLGPSGFGGYVLAATLAAVVGLVGMVGFNEAFVRFISERLAHKNARGAALVVRKGLAISGVCMLVGAPLAWIALTQFDVGLAALGDIRILAMLVVACAVLLALQQLGAEALRGFHQLRLASIFAGGQSGGLLASILLLGLVMAGSVFAEPSLTQVLVWFFAALLLTLPITYVFLWRTARTALREDASARREPHVPTLRQMLAVGGTMMVIHTLAFVTQQADLWIAGAYCQPDEVGLYGSARRLTLLTAMPVQIAMLAVISSIADLHVRGKQKYLQSLLRGTATLAAVPALLALTPILLAPGDVLALVFGDQYRGAEIPLVILALGYVPLIAFGNPVHALTMTGRHGIAMSVNLVTTCLLLAAGPLVVSRFGVNGLAYVSSGTLALQSTLLWLIARAKCGIWTHVGAIRPVLSFTRRDVTAEATSSNPALGTNGAVVHGEPARKSVSNGRPAIAGPTDLWPFPAKKAGLVSMDRIWWLSPEVVFAATIGLTALAAAWLSPEAYRQYGTPKYFTAYYLALAGFAVVAFTIGSWTARTSRAKPHATPPEVEANLGGWFLVAATLALAGYAIWGAVAVKNGLSLSSLSRFMNISNVEAADELKLNAMQTIPGVTTATQFGIAAFLLGVWLWSRGKNWVAPVLFVLCAATLLRTVLNSERLALLEVAVPAALVAIRTVVMERQWSQSARQLIVWLPAIAVAGVLVAFAATEYPRSWRHYRDHFNSFAEFTLWRASGYYTTALNNGAMAHDVRGTWPLPYGSLHAVWAFPLIEHSSMSYEALTGVDPEVVHRATLERFGNPELNNASGLFQPLLDFGPLGMIVYWLLFGWLAGTLYRGFLAGSVAGMAFYPILYLSLLEAPRILYLPAGRAFAPLAFLAVFALASRTIVRTEAISYSRGLGGTHPHAGSLLRSPGEGRW